MSSADFGIVVCTSVMLCRRRKPEMIPSPNVFSSPRGASTVKTRSLLAGTVEGIQRPVNRRAAMAVGSRQKPQTKSLSDQHLRKKQILERYT